MRLALGDLNLSETKFEIGKSIFGWLYTVSHLFTLDLSKCLKCLETTKKTHTFAVYVQKIPIIFSTMNKSSGVNFSLFIIYCPFECWFFAQVKCENNERNPNENVLCTEAIQMLIKSHTLIHIDAMKSKAKTISITTWCQTNTTIKPKVKGTWTKVSRNSNQQP